MHQESENELPDRLRTCLTASSRTIGIGALYLGNAPINEEFYSVDVAAVARG